MRVLRGYGKELTCAKRDAAGNAPLLLTTFTSCGVSVTPSSHLSNTHLSAHSLPLYKQVPQRSAFLLSATQKIGQMQKHVLSASLNPAQFGWSGSEFGVRSLQADGMEVALQAAACRVVVLAFNAHRVQRVGVSSTEFHEFLAMPQRRCPIP